MTTQRKWSIAQDTLHLPPVPGVYVMVSDGGEINYIGQSADIKARASVHKSYSHPVDHILFSKETDKRERLKLEDAAIKRYSPQRNIVSTPRGRRANRH